MSAKVFLNNVSRGTQQLGKGLLPWLLPILLIVIWQIASSTGLLQSRVLPAPTAVVSAFWHLLISGELWQHVKVSAGRALLGLLVGGGAGASSRLVEWLIPCCINAAGHHPANDPQHPCTCPDSTGDLMVWH